MRGGVFVRLKFRKEESAGQERKEEKAATAKAPASSIAQSALVAGARRPDFYERLKPATKVRGMASCWGALAKGDGAIVRREKPAKMKQRLVGLWMDSSPGSRPQRPQLRTRDAPDAGREA